MATITNGKYSAFNEDVKTLIVKASHINLTVSSDEAGTQYAKDNNGNDVNKKLVVSMNYTYPQVDEVTNQSTLGNFKISFSDGTSITVNDDNESHWYLLDGLDNTTFKKLV
jgi:hypothetical protein